MAPKPPAIVDLAWNGRLEFSAQTSRTRFVIDSDGVNGPSPVELLVSGLAGCMAVDLAYILGRGRHPFDALKARLVAERAAETPHRLTRVTLHFDLEGAVPTDTVARAIALSRDKYCSVWHSLRQDIELQVTFDVTA